MHSTNTKWIFHDCVYHVFQVLNFVQANTLAKKYLFFNYATSFHSTTLNHSVIAVAIYRILRFNQWMCVSVIHCNYSIEWYIPNWSFEYRVMVLFILTFTIGAKWPWKNAEITYTFFAWRTIYKKKKLQGILFR